MMKNAPVRRAGPEKNGSRRRRPVKSLGQHFLADGIVVGKIAEAAMLTKDDLVIEIGPGRGAVTAELCRRAGRVAAVEIDRHLAAELEAALSFYGNFSMINADILKTDIRELIEAEKAKAPEIKAPVVKIVSNLPYYITTPIIMKILEASSPEGPEPAMLILMMQKEVAVRIAASPGGKDYGVLSVAARYYTVPEVLFTVPPSSFIPVPGVESAVIRMTLNRTPPAEISDEKYFFRVVKAAFGQRRKTLVNALYNSGAFKAGKNEIAGLVEALGKKPDIRGETLSITDFARLAEMLSKLERSS
ncbi:MAG: 16S rRNA (adenine(1518)-N(6)/adenine(1519)-N(6))-dimethyltransferase RsmA [Eubacteriales bacterium]|nr:16S rRNA (adenine(1518)-N(6)/adenine(1519)-N(6))-dimethyltransferase RsmA [Eubacteriales bacterium]